VSEIQDRVVQDLSKIFGEKGVRVSKGDLNYDETSYGRVRDWQYKGFCIESMSPTVKINEKTYSCFPVFGGTTAGGTPTFSKEFGANWLEFSEE
jgi:hypothetical protein